MIFFKVNGKAQQPTSWGEGGASSSSPLLLECPDLYNQLCGIGSFLQITISPSLIKRKSKVISFFLILKDCIWRFKCVEIGVGVQAANDLWNIESFWGGGGLNWCLFFVAFCKTYITLWIKGIYRLFLHHIKLFLWVPGCPYDAPCHASYQTIYIQQYPTVLHLMYNLSGRYGFIINSAIPSSCSWSSSWNLWCGTS